MYDEKAIGKRIQYERNQLGLSQGKFAEKIGLAESSRQVIGKWEKGKLLPHFDHMLKMCELFECELGYLLCEYDCKTRVATDVKKATGLTEAAINRLMDINKSHINGALDTFSKLILHKEFGQLFRAMHLHICNFNKKEFKMDDQHAQELAQYLKCPVADVSAYFESSSRGLIETSFRKILSEIK